MRILWWLTSEAEKWIRENVCFEEYQKLGNGIAIDHHYIEDIVDGLLAKGFKPGVDFTAS